MVGEVGGRWAARPAEGRHGGRGTVAHEEEEEE